MKEGLFIGIDGGGTHSTAVAAWPDGRVAAVCGGEGLNFHNIGVEKVRTRLEDMVARLCETAGAPLAHVCVGMSALDGPADAATHSLFTQGSIPPGTLDLQSDAYIALMGFTRGEPGMIIICGTGSMLLLVDKEGNHHVSGGWGYLLGDAGSGYTLAREGVLAVIDESENMGPSTALTQDACDFFGVSFPRQMIDRIYAPSCTPDRLAGFARHVLERAGQGDSPAQTIVRCNMQRLARQAAQLLAKAPGTQCIGLYGGIFAHSALARSAFSETLSVLAPETKLCALDYTPELGAIIHLMQKHGTLNEASLLRLKQSYEEIRK